MEASTGTSVFNGMGGVLGFARVAMHGRHVRYPQRRCTISDLTSPACHACDYQLEQGETEMTTLSLKYHEQALSRSSTSYQIDLAGFLS